MHPYGSVTASGGSISGHRTHHLFALSKAVTVEGAFPFSELIPLDYLRRTVLAAAFAAALADANGLTVLEVDEDLDLLFRFHVL